MIVKDNANAGLHRVGVMGIRQVQEFAELGAAVAVAHQAQDFSVPQVDARQQG